MAGWNKVDAVALGVGLQLQENLEASYQFRINKAEAEILSMGHNTFEKLKTLSRSHTQISVSGKRAQASSGSSTKPLGPTNCVKVNKQCIKI
jgi:hypothetical protein